jgi:hypothetical protein
MMYIPTIVFVYLTPLCVWGGLLHYPLVLYLLATGKCSIAAGLCFLSMLLILAREPMSNTIRLSSMPSFELSGDVLVSAGVRPTLTLVHPHAMFAECVSMWGNDIHPGPGKYHSRVMFIDRYLYYFSPLGVLIMTVISGSTVAPLIHKRIKRYLAEGRSLFVLPGGFCEATDYTSHHENLYLHMYPYWMWLAREHPAYILQSVYGFNLSSRYYTQSAALLQTRLNLARRSLPGILPSGIVMSPTTDAIHLRVKTLNPHTDTLQDIADAMLATLTERDLAHGVKFGIRIT